MPVWHELTREARESGELVVVGLTQEQHPDRCALFAQWHEFDWPILWDPFNLTGSKAVPNVVAVDEHGVVRSERLRRDDFELGFMARAFEPPAEPLPAPPAEARRELAELARLEPGTFEHDHAAALSSLLWGRGDAGAALEALEAHARERPADGRLAFRAGVARRLRYDSSRARPDDFQAALDHWRRALALDPSQYVWRRRVQQYGPRLDKPYPFYSWVEEARAAIRARGEAPVPLLARLTPAELAHAQRAFESAPVAESPDPDGRVPRDESGWIRAETAVAFDTSGRHPVASVHVTLRPDAARAVHWSNEVEPTRVWLGAGDLPVGWKLDARLATAPQPAAATSDEPRTVTFEVLLPRAGAAGTLAGYALFHACEGVDGECVFLRHDFTVAIGR